MKKSPTTALVLSGGASLGAMQVGMLRALVDEFVRPDFIVGTSVGAVNGAFIASRGFTNETIEQLAELWRGIRRGHVFPLEPITGFFGFVGARKNLVPGGALRRLIRRHLTSECFEELQLPLHVVACDVLNGDEVRLSEGPLLDAVLASAAIPGVLPPIELRDRLLVDGGVVNNTPISHALELGAERVYVLPTAGPCTLAEPPRGALGMVVQATSLMVSHRFVEESLKYGRARGITIVPPPCPIRVQPMDFGRTEELIERAEATAREFFAGRRGRVVALERRRRPANEDARAARR